jgi:UDP:flavonoid glycosyltransferase YjiC (YdhE family)
MKTILMFPYANHLGGTQPLVAIGDELRKAGHRVVFAARGKCVRYITDAGFEVEDVIELDPQHAVDYINKSSLDYHDRASIAEFVAQESALIERHRPTAVVDLHRPTLGISARLTRTARAVLCNTVLTRYYAGEKVLPESHPLGAIGRSLPHWLLRPLSGWTEAALFRRWARPYNVYLREHGAAGVESMKDLFEGDATILMDAHELAATAALPPHVHMVGPLVHEQSAAAPDWLKQLGAGRKTIFVYLGSYGEMFSRIVGYLGRMFGGSADYQVVAATGGLYGYTGPACPPEVTVTDYVPASAVLGRRCAAMVAHGGRGSIYSALGHGVPLVGVPNQGEQEWNLEAIERLGLGRKLSTRQLSFESFERALRDVLNDPAYAERARHFRDTLVAYDGARRAAQIIADLG